MSPYVQSLIAVFQYASSQRNAANLAGDTAEADVWFNIMWRADLLMHDVNPAIALQHGFPF